MILSFTRVTLRVLALLGQVTWTGTVCFRGGKWGGDAPSGTRAAYSPLNGVVGCEGGGGLHGGGGGTVAAASRKRSSTMDRFSLYSCAAILVSACLD